MPLGPVFNAELLTTARRARYYVVRSLYGSIILFQVYLSYQSNTYRLGVAQGQLRIKDMSDFALELFGTFAILQAVVVLMLTPALVGGTIADERQRKTLHYLLTSRLSSAEIILGKLAARLLQVAVLVALGLPVVSLIGLFGGIDYQILLMSYAGTMTTIYFLASASILISVISRRPRDAISLIYILELVWLIVPTLVMNALIYGSPQWREIGSVVNPVLEYVAITSPIYLLSPRAMTSPGAYLEAIYWGMGLQVAYGTLFVILAAIRLRPSARNDGERRGLSKWFAGIARKRRWFPRPDCGDDAMLWKEMHVSRTGGVTKVAFILIGVLLLGMIGYWGFDIYVAAMDEMSRDGYFVQGNSRSELNGFLRGFSTGIYLLWFLGVASSAATVLCSEREEDQWLTLTSTPLSGREILRAKMIGPVWSFRLAAYLMFALWGLGLLVGAIHPFGLLACFVEFAVFSWFLTALGTFFSLRAKNSTRALASTMALLIFLNGGYLFCCIPFHTNSMVIGAGSTPFVFAISLLSVRDFSDLSNQSQAGELILACILSVLFYGLAAAGLTAASFSTFDTVVDRPDRLRQDRTPGQQAEYLRGQAKVIKPADELA